MEQKIGIYNNTLTCIVITNHFSWHTLYKQFHNNILTDLDLLLVVLCGVLFLLVDGVVATAACTDACGGGGGGGGGLSAARALACCSALIC